MDFDFSPNPPHTQHTTGQHTCTPTHTHTTVTHIHTDTPVSDLLRVTHFVK